MKPVFELENRDDAGEDAGATDDFGFRVEDSPLLLVFVYGTLRSGNSDHRQLRTARPLGRGRTREQFALYLGVTPYVIKSEKVSWIVGEVYEVDARTLRRLDLLQQCPSWRFREWVDVILDDGQELQAMMYFAKEKKRQLVLSGHSDTG